MKWNGICDRQIVMYAVVFPFVGRNGLAGCAVDDFPPSLRIVDIIGNELFAVKSVQKINC